MKVTIKSEIRRSVKVAKTQVGLSASSSNSLHLYWNPPSGFGHGVLILALLIFYEKIRSSNKYIFQKYEHNFHRLKPKVCGNQNNLFQFVELLLEITLSLGLVKFVQLALAMCGGSHTLVQVRLTFNINKSSVFEAPDFCTHVLHSSLNIDPYFCFSSIVESATQVFLLAHHQSSACYLFPSLSIFSSS